MAGKTKIEWCRSEDGVAGATWNPVRGCTKISPGCKFCYAERFAERFRGVAGHPYAQGFDLRLVPEAVTLPLRWERPRTVFVNSMSDLFHEVVPAAYIELVCRVMTAASWHTFQVLTKRADRMSELLNGKLAWAAKSPHIWWGVSVENRAAGLPRVETLKRTAISGIKFLSIEPLLEDLGEVDLRGVDWIIVGGESGAGARPLEAAWVRGLLCQARRDGSAYFFKQWGGVNKAKYGRLLDGRTYDEMPTRATTKVSPAAARLALVREIEATLKATDFAIGEADKCDYSPRINAGASTD